jgi:hypothetical protein
LDRSEFEEETVSEDKREQFEYWLAHMDDGLEEFMRTLPPDVARKLDYSIGSLDVLERLLLERYDSFEAAQASGDSKFFDGCARYVGETVRKHMGGKWTIVLDDKKNAHYGVPSLIDFKVPMPPMAPLHMCKSATDRRKGNFISGVVRNYYKG